MRGTKDFENTAFRKNYGYYNCNGDISRNLHSYLSNLEPGFGSVVGFQSSERAVNLIQVSAVVAL